MQNVCGNSNIVTILEPHCHIRVNPLLRTVRNDDKSL